MTLTSIRHDDSPSFRQRAMHSDRALTPGLVKERAAHQKRNWVRLTYDCNAHCLFCLDAKAQDGTHRDRDEIKHQILDGRRKGAERLILSGGEPTIHPNFLDFVRLGVAAGYHRIQTVTNGRMLSYPEFLKASLDAGLGEITFSIHGPNAQIHDALLGTEGAFEQITSALRGALADGRPVVNIDVCVNRANVKLLPEMLEKVLAMGVREFDLLQVIPFGRAYAQGKEALFYDFDEMRPYLRRAFAMSRLPGVQLWLNRFPPSLLEGFEDLIQDPYKLKDEVRGRKEEYGLLLETGEPLDCRSPDRCQRCYMEPVCDDLDQVRAQLAERDFEIVRIDTECEATLPPVYGGDPASRKRSQRELLPVVGSAEPHPRPTYATPEQIVALASVRALWIVAPDLESAERELRRFPSTPEQLELELADITGLESALEGETLDRCLDRRLTRVLVNRWQDAERLLGVDAVFDVVVPLSQANAEFFLGLEQVPPRLIARQPCHGRMSDSAARDLDLSTFFGRLQPTVSSRLRVEGVPHCVLGREPSRRPPVLDSAMLDPAGRLEIFRFAERFIGERFCVKSARCRECVYDADCDGLHINQVRAHGFAAMQPVGGGEARAQEAGG